MKLTLPYKAGTVRITSPYGMRTLLGTTAMHNGIDLVGTDKNIVAPCDGTIGWAGFYNDKGSGGRTWEWGNYVRIDRTDGYSVYMCHMSSVAAKAGQKVKAGDPIGVEGSTGYSTGSHCHFEVRYAGKSTDPAVLLGIANRVGSYPVTTTTAGKTNADLVCERCGLEGQTRAYLNAYKYADDLWRKLWEAMK